MIKLINFKEKSLDDADKIKSILNSVGRPTLYEPEYCQQLIDYMATGMSFESFAATLGVCRETLYDWKKRHPEFLHAHKIGIDRNLQFWERLGTKMATGESKGNTVAWIFNIKNRHGWTDKNEVSLHGENIPIKIVFEDISKPNENYIDDPIDPPNQILPMDD